MTNEELLEKLKKDLNPFDEYCPGLHNISLIKHRIATESPLSPLENSRRKEFIIPKPTITEEDIAEQILKTGLKVVDLRRGLGSTVMRFYGEITPKCFDYNFNINHHRICNIIVGRPTYIIYEGQKYLLGDLNDNHNVGNEILFNETLSPAFIYGYYSKQIVGTKQEHGYRKNIYSAELTFHENPTFWAFLSPEEREAILSQIFQEKTGALSCIKLANNNQFLKLLFKTPLEREAIHETRTQIKRLKLKRN